MANPEHVRQLQMGIANWNRWRLENHVIRPSLSSANLSRIDLSDGNFRNANFEGSTLVGADLIKADLTAATLINADLTGANLTRTNLTEADLTGAKLHSTVFRETSLNGCQLANASGLDHTIHLSYSYIDYRTLDRSSGIPALFLRGCGLSDKEIALYEGPVLQENYSCFISYSHHDSKFATNLYNSLQEHGVRCWLDQKNLRIGDDFYDTISLAVRRADKIVIVLSNGSLTRPWVEREVKFALAEEIERSRLIILPLALDDAPFQTIVDWARRMRETRQIGDFRDWGKPRKYQTSLEHLLLALKRS
jgi:hypothetical protein